MAKQKLTIIGAGLVGALLARLLAMRGFAVDVFEKRCDPRPGGGEAGRSINLALAERGLHALRCAGLTGPVMAEAVMMRGRMVHVAGEPPNLQRYGVDDSEVIWSVPRSALNVLLVNAAEAAGVRFHFDQALIDADFPARRITVADERGARRSVEANCLIGADGAGSALRAAMGRHAALGERTEWLDHGYKELEIPPVAELASVLHGALPAQPPFALEPHALHIWPRGGYMCIALPNTRGSFTVTLFLPNRGAGASFASLPDAAAARAFFQHDFGDLLALMPRFEQHYQYNPVGPLGTLYLDRWHIDDRALLLGDAAHAIVPFHGQGMNCGFEDALELAQRMVSEPRDYADVFAGFQQSRQPNTNAIAAMALQNYAEMRDAVTDPRYLARRALGQRLAAAAPGHFMARYRMVTFTRLPYAYALERGDAQDQVLDTLLDENQADTIDIHAAVQTLKATLAPLPELVADIPARLAHG